MTSTPAFYGEGTNFAAPAAADLSALQFTAITINTSGQAASQAAGTSFTAGVLLNKPKSGDQAQVRALGVTKVLLGGTVASGAQIMPTTGGAFITATSTNYPVGFTLFGGVSGDIVTAFILPGQAKLD